MKKTSLALIVAMTAFGSMTATAAEGTTAGTTAGASTGAIAAGSIAAAAAIAGAVVASNGSDGNPITTTGTGTTPGTGN